MRHSVYEGEPTREQLIGWYRRTRARTRHLFDLITEDAYYDRPIALRNPIVFYEGHIPAFAVNTLVKLTRGKKGIDEHFETLFARGIDPEDEASAKAPTDLWPARAAVQAYGKEADRLVEEHVENCEAAFTVIEHELMHQETLMYMFHALPFTKKRRMSPLPARRGEGQGEGHVVRIPAGKTTLGQASTHFGWDNEFPSHTVDVPSFEIDAHNVSNAEFLEFVKATGAEPPHFLEQHRGTWYRRTMFALEPMPGNAPVYVTHDQAVAYAAWKGKRLPTEAEWHRAATGAPLVGNFDFDEFDPVPRGSYAPGEFGVYDLYGNGWEWTSSLFAPFEGFKPMPSYLQYSTDFFDGAHYVLKGASPVTARGLVRPSFRNWFRPSYPYVFATFRLVAPAL